MLLTFDQTNFPLLVVESVGVEVHLLPITSWQFDRFVTDGGVIAQSRYKTLLDLNPLIGAEQVQVKQREQIFVTGILPAEAQAFAAWLGEGFDLPTVKEWRAIYAALRVMPLPVYELSSALVEGPAGLLLDKFSEGLQARSMLDYSLLHGGLVEWVRQGESWVGLGAPRPQFHAHLWDPLTHEVKPINLESRLPYFGFRLVRRGEYYLADRENVRYIH